jgi:hypothetical protein
MSVNWEVKVDDVARLEPTFRDDVAKLLGGSPYDWRIIYAYRTLALQKELYDKFRAGGPRAAPAGESPHNFGLAVDVQLWVHDNPINNPMVRDRMDWNVKNAGWQWLFGVVAQHPRLHSGISFGDFDHIERVDWKLYKNWARTPDDPLSPGSAT